MNKIFRIVWSQATQSWVVVSELTKAHKKQSASNAQKSAVKFSGNFLKSSAIALTLLSGHSAYAAVAGSEGHANAVAFGPDSNASTDGSVALGKQAKATGGEAAALGKGAKAEGNLSVAVAPMSQATADSAMAFGVESKASGAKAVALGRMAVATQESAVALGFKSKATSFNTVALGTNTEAAGQRSMAFGNEAKATANDTIAFGSSSEAKKNNDIIIGKEAKSRDEGGGHSVAIGLGATSGSNKVNYDRNGGDAGSVAIGTGAYTGVNRNNVALNSSVAIGAGAGAGFRSLDANNNNMPAGNATDVESNDEVLKKAFGVKDVKDYAAIAGGANGYTNVDINEATALGRNARAIGDQAVAIGAQTIAGMGAIALGGNDITQFAHKKYYKSTKDNFKVTETIDHNQDAVVSNRTISQTYKDLVGTELDTAYKATYAQDGSVVLGAQAHSGTPLGTAIGTNALVRKGAFGATAIGAGSQIQANAEAAVAIGMGSVANGAYAVAAGTASRAEYGDIALGYQAQATGKDGAIAMGRATNAQGDSSIMIGGANIASAAAQNTSFEKSNGTITKKTVTEKINGKDVSREYTFAGTTKTNGTVAVAYKELTGRDMETNALNFADNKYKNGHASTSLGVHALSKGDLGTAIGAGSRSDAIGSVALGTGAHATRQNAVAIGTGSTTELVGTRQLSVSYNNKGEIVDDNSKDVAYTFNWAGGTNTAEGDVVSFGSSGAERQLKNVAAGRVAEDSTDAINGSQLNSISKKVALGWNIAGDPKTRVAGIGADDQVNFVNGNGTTVTVEKQDEVKSGDKVTTPKGANVKFDVKAKDGSITSNADGITVNTDGTTITKDVDGKLKVNTGNITNSNGVPTVADADKNKIATAETVANAIKDSYWIASATKGTSSIGNDDNIKAGTKVIFDAGKNIEIEHSTANKFTFKTVDTPEFKNITLNDGTANPNKVSLTPTADGLKLSKGDNADSPVKITNVAAGTDEKDAVNYKQLQDALNSVSSSWKIEGSANGGTYNKDASTATAEQIVSKDDKVGLKAGKNIVLDQSGKEFTYSLSKELTELEKVEVKDDKGNTVVTTPTGTTVTDKDGNTSKLDGTGLTITPNGNTDPNKNVSVTKDGINAGGNTISNVAGNLPGAKTGTDSPTTNAAAPNNVDAIKNNAATVGDVLNAGWNLQGNGVAKDFVKPYDTVNFVDGMNTRAVVTTDADGKVSNVQIDVKDLPIAYTNAAGDKVVKGPDNKFYKESDLADKVYDPATKMFKNANGTPLAAQPAEVAKDDIKTNLVNPNAEGNKAGDPTELGNIKSGLDTIKDATGGTTPSATDKAAGLVNLDEKDPQTNKPKVSDNNAATVGDLRKMGWVVSSDKTTDGTGEYSDQVKNANEVRFVGKGTAKVSGKTEGNVRTITVEVNDQLSTNNSVTPVVYTKADGTQVYPIKQADGTIKFNTKPDGTGEEVDKGDVITSVNGPDGTKSPTTLKNIAGNLEGAKKDTTSPTTNAAAPNDVDTIKNNAATVGDVLNAGWNLQNNGTAKDFVKPYDTVNFVNGANTTAVVTTSADGTTSNVTYNVTGLPVTYTDAEGNPVAKIGDKYYKVNDKGQPLDANGQPSTKVNDKGQPVDENGNEIAPVDTTKPLKTALVNPTPAGDKTNTTDPTALNNVTSGLNKYGDTVDGAQVPGSTPANNGLVDLSKPADGSEPKVSDNTAATVGDLRNMGWIVSSDKTTGSLDTPYTATVKNANEVKFVGEGTATVSGKTDEKGVRTITVKVDDQVSTNNAVTPVVYTDKEGNTVYPIKDDKGNVTYHTTPDGKGENDKVVPNGDVNTSINGPKDEQGNTRPASLSNVKNNIPAVNDTDKKVTNPDGKDKPNAGDVANINKAPLTATEAADLLNPTKDGKSNPNFVGNNAATVSDVLNAGWNLQNNGEARDFVKPFDTVNFVNGGNTTAVVTTAADGTTSDVTFNVTGLPITYTTADGKPVSKVGDKYYPVNKKGQPIGPDGKPAVKTAPNGDLLDEAGNVIQPIDTAKDPLKSNLVNPNVANSDAAPNNQTTSPTQLGNVANGANTFDPVDSKKMANDGKWYTADQVEPNGQPKTGAAPVEVPANIGKAGLIDFSNSNPNNAATVGDLQNLGWIVSAKGNNYSDQVRNANKVEFKGTNGVEVTGKTLEDGTREITVGLKEGKVTNDVIVTKADGTETHAVRGEDGKIYTKDPVTGKATTTEIQLDKGDTVTNDGNALVTGNKVATAIQKSGWNVGIGSTDKDFSTEAKTFEKVNPNDNVKYVNGANTTVSMAVDAAEDKDGTAVTTTYVKVDVNRDLNIDSVTTGGPAKDKAGNPLKQVNGEYYPENALVNDGKVYPAGTVIIDGKPYPAGSAKDPKTNEIVKDGKPAPEVQPLSATPKDQLADGKDGAMTVKDAKGNDGVSATAKDGKGTLTLKDAGKDGKDASQVDISTAKAPADLENTPKDAVRANDGNWYTPADVTVEVKDGKTVVTPKAGKTPIPNAPTMDRIQYTGTDGKPRNVATMDDGLRFVGDDGETISKPLNSTMEFTGGNRENGKPVAKEDTTTGNIGVFHDNGKLSVQLAKDLEKMNSANFETPDGTSTKITGNGLSVTPETAKLKDPKTGKPILDKDGNPKVDPKKVVSFGGPTIMKDPKTGKPVVDSKTGEPVMESGISAGGQVMTNVAPGRISPTSTDAVNGSQLHAVASSIGNLNNKINKVGKHADAGTASALAASNIPQAYTPGKSLVGIAAGSYQGQTGVAVGMSRISDNGKIIIRLSGTTNTQGRAGVAAGVGYQW